ncbi:hypothetical protein INS49_007585, partial [Diaporthe citri]|uniref:uncharacterized protein n=1 Tax=Diaporthe citri TaxID=83186 RepID=UPI001C81DEEA
MYGTGTGAQTGVSTPRSSASLRPLTVSHGTLETSFLIPTSLHFHALQLKDRFSASLPPPTDELAQDDEPSSTPELGEDDSQGSYEDVLKLILNEFERAFLRGNDVHALVATLPGIDASEGMPRAFLRGNDVHALVATLPGIDAKKSEVLRSYYASRSVLNRAVRPHQSALFRASEEGDASIYNIFGGQGNIEEYFEELRELWQTYPSFVGDLILTAAEQLQTLANNPSAEKLFTKGLDIMNWLQNPEATPDVEYLITAPVSFPLIGLVQLAHYEVTCKALGIHPGTLRERISGTTGHSQGVVMAAATAAADSWETWPEIVKSSLSILFWIGARSQQTFPRTSMTPSVLQDSIENGEGTPTPMLSIRDLSQDQVQTHIDATNKYLPADRHIAISLINSPRNMVVTGPPMSLYGLNLQLRKVKAPTGLDQTRIPHTQRKVRFVNRFLPITAPFHSKYLAEATSLIDEDLKNIKIDAESLAIPVYDTNTGKDIREEVKGSLATTGTGRGDNFENATRRGGVLDFAQEGTGVRVILAGTVSGSANDV